MGRHEEQVLINRRDVMEKKVRREGGRQGQAGLISEVTVTPYVPLAALCPLNALPEDLPSEIMPIGVILHRSPYNVTATQQQRPPQNPEGPQ